nr:hypothetical protein [Rhizobium sp. ACO-34A]
MPSDLQPDIPHLTRSSLRLDKLRRHFFLRTHLPQLEYVVRHMRENP